MQLWGKTKINKQVLNGEKRLIFKNVTSSVETAPGTTEETIVTVQYIEDAKTTFKDLAKKVYPNNQEKQTEYFTNIVDSLDSFLQENGKSLEQLWKWLNKMHCKIASILKDKNTNEESIHFYADTEGTKEIRVENFTHPPLTLSATPELEKATHAKRMEVFNKTHSKFSELIAQIKETHPELPELPTKQ